MPEQLLDHNSISSKTVWKKVWFFVFWGICFALAYSQSPLFTSNQNQYFLHGLGRAGWGYLEYDWLFNTLDPTPVFSFFVEWTYRIFHTTVIYYLIYGILQTIYFFSVIGILNKLFVFWENRKQRSLILVLVILIHSALMRGALSYYLGENWTFVLEGGVAGQRILGTVLQPSAFGCLFPLSIYLFLEKKLFPSTLILILVANIHPTYLLTSGLLTAGYLFILVFLEKDFKDAVKTAITPLLGVLPILANSFFTFSATAPELYAETREKLVYFRIPHHAVPAEWFNASAIAQIILVAAALTIIFFQNRRLFWIFSVSAFFVSVLTAIQINSGSNFLALVFPWRPSVVLVPLSSCILLGFGFNLLWTRWPIKNPILLNGIISAVILAMVAAGIFRFRGDLSEKQNDPAAAMMAFIRENNTPVDNYIVPMDMQDFRLETGSPIVVEFKAIPYKDVEVATWLTRVQNISNLYQSTNLDDYCLNLRVWYKQWHATHIVLPAENFGYVCDGMENVYQDDHYAVYSLNIIDP
ncbi:MAG: hypothetical protein JXA19_01980 [Anaerolineales bacterium]|nr:hypothetical protein [Anaerolineales bacterium]